MSSHAPRAVAAPCGPRIAFGLAGPEHDAALRRLAAVPMEGAIRIALRREPSYLAATRVEGPFRQTLIAVDRETGELAGMGSRSVRTRFLDGTPAPVGYLSGLRSAAAHRRRTLLARGYAFLRRLHGDGRTALYVTTIAADNQVALDALTGGRCGLPTYEPYGLYHTLVIPTRQRSRARPPDGLEVRPAVRADRDALVGFLRRAGAARQFAPAYEAADLFGPEATLRDLAPEDIRIAWRAGRIVGTLASWDQSGFKQTVVAGYRGAVKRLRPVVNAWARLRGRPSLPAAGGTLPHRMLALPFAADDDPGVMRALLENTLRDHARRAARVPAWGLVLLGLHERDPLLAPLRRFALRTYLARLYVVHWADGRAARESLDGRPPYLELGCL